jgi:hypothetical protein
MAAGVRPHRDAHRLKTTVLLMIMYVAGRRTPAPPRTKPINTRSKKGKEKNDRARCLGGRTNGAKKKIHRRILRFTTLNNEIIISYI